MMDTTVTLDERHYKIVAEKARSLDQTPQQFLQALIDAQDGRFDDSPSPAFAGSASTSGRELDTLFQRARTTTRHVDE